MVGKRGSLSVPTPLISNMKRLNVPGDHTLFHYAWVIVAVASFAQLSGSVILRSFGVLVNPLMADFGWSATGVGFVYGTMSIVAALMAPIAGWLSGRYGARKTMFAGSVLFLIGMIWTARIDDLWELFVAYGVVLGTAKALFLVPVVPVVAIWFRRHLGLATGILMLSWSAGPAVVVQLVAVLLSTSGWQATFLWIGGIATVMMLGSIAIFRDSPEQANRRPYGWRRGENIVKTSGQDIAVRASRFQGYVYRTDGFWNLINIHFLGCVGHSIILIGIVPMAIHHGMSPLAAAGVLTTFTGASLISRFLTPVLGESIGSKSVMFIALAGQGLSVLLLLGNPSPTMFYVFALVFALPYGGEGSAFPVINRQYYGQAPMGVTYGWQLLGAGLGMALGGILTGVTFDLTNSYTVAIVISALFSLTGAFSVVLLEATDHPIIPDWDSDDRMTNEPRVVQPDTVSNPN